MIEVDEEPDEAARRQAKAADEVRAEDDPLALTRRRRDLSLRRHARLHVACAGETPRLAEEGYVILVDVGSVPVSSSLARHGELDEERRGEEAESGAEQGGSGERARRRRTAAALQCSSGGTAAKGRRRRQGRGRGARELCRSLSSPTYSLRAMKPRGRAWDRGINYAHDPTSPCLSRELLRAVTPRGNSTARLGRSGSARVPRPGGGGPSLQSRPITRVGWQAGPAGWHHVACPRQAADREA